ncbi:GTPase SAR1 family protein [Bifidobacterium commune]|uniref:GTPase domain-containing protein n=1 Tax=Bifidobacterium commune TaxID=1505727 RepID=UPI000B83E274|nr:GTPase domain-containing protein [Bifidobacterium commune]MBB2954841.1 GTPase SAR1 family protein [Bifidobacterium commune]
MLVLGNDGVGKTTLINAVLGQELSETGFGGNGTTTELKIYETDALPFKLIDSVGFEHLFHAASGCRVSEEMDQKGYQRQKAANRRSVVLRRWNRRQVVAGYD